MESEALNQGLQEVAWTQQQHGTGFQRFSGVVLIFACNLMKN